MSKQDAQLLADACVTPELRDRLAKTGDGYAQVFWIDYVLTTANTWRTPISDFRLVVERPNDEGMDGSGRHGYVSFCWDGPVRRLDADHFEVSVKNFVPQRELHVAFLAGH